MNRITELFAYVTTVNNDESIATYQVRDEQVQLVAVDRQHADGMQPMARTVADEIQAPLRLVRFASVEELAVVEPVA